MFEFIEHITEDFLIVLTIIGLALLPVAIPVLLIWFIYKRVKNMQETPETFFIIQWNNKGRFYSTINHGPVDQEFYDMIKLHPSSENVKIIASGSFETVEKLIG